MRSSFPPFVRVDRVGQLSTRPANDPPPVWSGLSQLAVHAYGAAQRGRVAAFGLQHRVHVGQPLAQPLVG